MFSLIINYILFSPFIYLCDAFTSLAISFVKRKPKTKKQLPPQFPFVKGTECGVPAIPFVKGCKLLCRGLLSCPHCVVLNIYIYIFFVGGALHNKKISHTDVLHLTESKPQARLWAETFCQSSCLPLPWYLLSRHQDHTLLANLLGACSFVCDAFCQSTADHWKVPFVKHQRPLRANSIFSC